MSTIELVLANPESLEDELSLFFELRNTPIALKYKDVLIESERLAITNPDRFYNFPHGRLDRHALAARINHCVDAVNGFAPGVIPLKAEPHMDQDRLNRLHHYFEVLRGPILSSPEFMRCAPLNVQVALEHLNLNIHQFEWYERAEEALRQGQTPDAFVVVTFYRRQRHLLADEDYAEFTKRRVFGTWCINYCEVGKPLWDVYQDKDEVVGDANIRPLRYYSPDAAIEFGATATDAEHASMMAEFRNWWARNEAALQRLGFEMDDPRNGIGAIPVADLVRDRGSMAGRSDEEIRDLVGRHQYVARVVCEDDSGPSDTRRIFEKRVPARLEARPDLVRRIGGSYQFKLTGEGGGNWVVDLTKGDKGEVHRGTMDGCQLEVNMSAADFIELCRGRSSTQMAIVQGKLRFEGSWRLLLELRQLFG